MENIDFATLFQGFGTMMESGYLLASARVFLILLGLLLIYLGWKGVLEPMVMIPSHHLCSHPALQHWQDRKSTRLNSSHMPKSRMPSSA